MTMKNDKRKGYNYLSKAEIKVMIDCSIGKLAGKFNLELEEIRKSLVHLKERDDFIYKKMNKLLKTKIHN